MRTTLIAGLLLALLSSIAQPQAVDITFKMPAVGGVRETHAYEDPNVAPVWSPAMDLTPDLQKDASSTIDLSCSDPNGDATVITVASGTPNTGLSLISRQITGIPTVPGSATFTLDCSDGALSAQVSMTITVSATPTPDSTPDQFACAPVIGAPKNTTGLTICTLTLTGTNTNTTCNVTPGTGTTGAQFKVNSGSFTTSPSSAPPNAVITQRLNTPDAYEAQRQMTLTCGGISAIASATTLANPGRTDVFYTLDFESLNAQTNPNNSGANGWQAAPNALHDGLIPQQIACTTCGPNGAAWKQPGPGADSSPSGGVVNCSGTSPTSNTSCEHAARTAAIAALPHLQIIDTAGTVPSGDPTPLLGTKYLRGTLYIRPFSSGGYTANYCDTNGNGCGTSGGKDKPRNDLSTKQAGDAALDADSNHNAFRKTQFACFDIGFPSSYHEDYDKKITILQNVSADTTPENSFDLSLVGGGSAASPSAYWQVQRLWASGTSNQGKTCISGDNPCTTNLDDINVNVVNIAGKQVTHCFRVNVDNRDSGGSPRFKWMVSKTGDTKLTTIYEDTLKYGYAPNMPDKKGNTGPHALYWNFTLGYGGGLNGNNGTYNGAYRGEAFSLTFDNFRVGGPSSSIADVHPLRFPEPTCGTPGNPATYPCTD